MDATKRPLIIPPNFSNYAERKEIFHLLQYMLEELLVTRPDDPLDFLIKVLDESYNEHAPRVIIYGPPSSGQHTLCKVLARKMRTVLIRPRELLDTNYTYNTPPLLLEFEDGEKIAKLIFDRIQKPDCKTKGFIIEGYPRTREQALQLQACGVTITHFGHLRAPNSVLLERYDDKRIDPITGDVYHLVFKPPTDPSIASRVIQEAGGVEHNMLKGLKCYAANNSGIAECYKSVCNRCFDADQPDSDLMVQVRAFLQKKIRSLSPLTPRVVLLGPTGVGKSWQASQLSSKYQLIDVDIRVLMEQELVSNSLLGQQMRPFADRNLPIPDQMVLSVLTSRLTQLDCTTKGWVLHGFPSSREQAELLHEAGLAPNRVFFITAPVDIIKERLCWRRTDPVTGERYHLLYNPPLSHDIKERLATHLEDEETQVDDRISEYNSTASDIHDYYTDISVHVTGDNDPYVTMETLESYIVNPLPKKLSPD